MSETTEARGAGLLARAAAIKEARAAAEQAAADLRACNLAAAMTEQRYKGGSELASRLEGAAVMHATEPLPAWARQLMDEVTARQWDTATLSKGKVAAAANALQAADKALAELGGQL